MRNRYGALGALLLLALAFPAALLAQLDQSWAVAYDGPYPGPGDDRASKVVADADGNVYVTGYSATYTPYQDNYNTVKYDAEGNLLWSVQYNGPGNGNDRVNGMTLDASGNVFVTGNSVGSGTGNDYATVKYDAAGNELWVARYNGPGNGADNARSIVVDGSGNVYVTGFSLGSSTNCDYATVKYDAAGNELWVARYNGPGNGLDRAYDVAVDASGDVYVTGYGPGSGTGNDYATVKYDAAGNELWVARYNGPANGSDQAQFITIDGSGYVFVTGNSAGSGTGNDYATVMYDAAGNEEWVRRYNGPGNGSDMARSITIDGSGNCCVTGYSPGSGTGNDYATVKYDAAGNELWVARYNGPANGSDQAQFITIDGSGNVFVTGNSAGSGTGNDYATVKYDAAGNELWVARYDGPANGSDNGSAIAADASGNCYVTGYSAGSATGNDYATVKYDATGNELWVARYSCPLGSYDYGHSVAMDASGNVYVVGYGTDAQGFKGDYVTIKYNAAGVEQWVARYGGPGTGTGTEWAIAVDATGNCCVTGESYGSGTDRDYATVMYDAAGNQLWVARYNGPGNYQDGATAVAFDASGNVYVTGYSYGSGTSYDYATVKYDAAGNELWVARYNGPRNGVEDARAIAVDASGNVCVTGYSLGGPSRHDYATVKYDAAGNELWVARYNEPGNGTDYPYAIALDASGSVYVTGSSGEWGRGRYADYATVKYDVNGVEQWVARYGGPANRNDYANSIALDASGNVYVTGYSPGSGTGDDYATVKYDATGNELWVARYNGPGNGSDYGYAIAVDALGNSYVTGYSAGSGTGYDIATIKYDPSGNEMGLARYDGPSSLNDYGYSIALGPSGAVCVTGVSEIIGHSTDIMTVMYHSPLGWAARAELPEPPSGKKEGAGGWLAYNAGDLKIYAAKGDGTPDFYAYDTRTDAWVPLTPIPAGAEQALPQDGCRGVTDGGDMVYMTKGANTLGFWGYAISTASWTQLADVPEGKQKVKGGTDLAYVAVEDVGYVYMLKGQGCEFYRYNTETGEWSRLADAPSGKNGQWLAGSWLVYDGDHSLYAHKALSQEMYRFDLTSGAWDPDAIEGMPQAGSDGGKVQLGPGGCAAWLNGAAFALKGNNTNQLWAYVPGNGWHELDAVPETGTSGQKKRVHLGGDITATENMLFAFKGSKTNELWRCVPYPEFGDGGALAGRTPITRFALSVAPNPMRHGAAIRYAVPAPTNVSLKLYDITGALAKTVRSGWVKPGSYTAKLSPKGLARGVYILKMKSDACDLTRKVVIE